ncbi:hypothetical protein RFI_13828 [Reticulomyxa filosa]|uniref:WASH complex subunit 7 C-terminal domain-containing protein n=1 Tax=Reticulomyxa filosa TaxID=46433 RepID=X6NC46_RETFI|nr:hypothetical protein RFI_13828 [Reticulomyxa filosa]|eukprot:ETO23354.1 hypothetical protein RFI_13828 [Reticulomyxa filosa]
MHNLFFKKKNIVVPPLTYNFVESQIGKKDRLGRKPGKDEAGFTDDGFALGCAFILRVLNLYDEFDALHWWDEVMEQMAKQDQQQQPSGKAEKSRQENDGIGTWEGDLSFKRNKLQKTEWKLLFYSFQAARIFFRNADVKKAEQPESDKKSDHNFVCCKKNLVSQYLSKNVLILQLEVYIFEG